MFKVGDMVRCIDIPSSGILTKTAIYTVEESGQHYGPDLQETIKIEGIHWFAFRFELVKENNMDHYEIEINVDVSSTIKNWVPLTSLGKILQCGDLCNAEKRVQDLRVVWFSGLRIVRVETITNTVRTVV